MKTTQQIDQLKDQIIANLQEQIVILKSINETNDKVIDKYRDFKSGAEAYIDLLKDQISQYETLLINKL